MIDAESGPSPVHEDRRSTRPTFEAYSDAGFATELLPIIPPAAEIHPDSPSYDALLSARGKVPGRKRRGGWMGFGDWTDYQANSDDRYVWSGSGAGIGLQGRNYPGLDIDINDWKLADDVDRLAAEILGPAPTRFGASSRRLKAYSGSGHAKKRITVRRIGGSDKDSVSQKVEAVEWLATGQQYVIEGIHPSSLRPYRWLNDRSPAEWGASNLTAVTTAQIAEFYQNLESILAGHGYEVATRQERNLSQNRVSQENLRAPSMNAVRRALAAVPNECDYDTWLKIGAAVKGAAGQESEGEALELWIDWSLQWPTNTPEAVKAKWNTLHAPFKVGWPFLARYATQLGDGSFHAAAEDFAEAAPPETTLAAPGTPGGPLTAMFDRYVYVNALDRVVDLTTGDILGRSVFNVENRHIGSPVETKGCAWAVLTSNVPRLQTAKALTYRPGQGAFIHETLPGLLGRCVNIWRPSDMVLPDTATDLEVSRWLEHVELIVPDERERSIMLDWLAWIIQNPGEKPNWALVIGSSSEGIGKDMMMEPVRVALGPWNVREVGPEDLASPNSDYLERTRLLLIEEMQRSERKAMENKLKPLIAAPPYTLRVNVKFVPQYEIPNLVACVFFTNNEDALAISAKSRRYFVTWNDSEPLPDDYFISLAAWYGAGGAAKAARWLTQRDVSKFNAKGRAPATAARERMQAASSETIVQIIREAIEDGDGPFAFGLVTLPEVTLYLKAKVNGDLSRQQAGAKLRAAGCTLVGRGSLGDVPPGAVPPVDYDDRQTQIWATRRGGAVSTKFDVLRPAFWAQREAGTNASVFG